MINTPEFILAPLTVVVVASACSVLALLCLTTSNSPSKLSGEDFIHSFQVLQRGSAHHKCFTNASVLIVICHLQPQAVNPRGKGQYLCIPVARSVPGIELALRKCLFEYSFLQSSWVLSLTKGRSVTAGMIIEGQGRNRTSLDYGLPESRGSFLPCSLLYLKDLKQSIARSNCSIKMCGLRKCMRRNISDCFSFPFHGNMMGWG